jgi:AcrR family transcriptional regulator
MSTETSPEGRQRLLQAALDHLATRSEADLRVTEIAATAGVAIGLIRHHFGSRDGLVTAAQQVRLAGAVKRDLAAAQGLLSAASDTDELLDGVRQLTTALLDPDRRDIRLARIAVIGTAHGRPEVRDAYAATVEELIDALDILVTRAQAAGFARRDLDARAIATFIQAYALGMTLHDLDPKAVTRERMIDVIMVAVRSVFLDAGKNTSGIADA